ncbi:MAG: hypothetical protein ACOC6B_07255 [Thermodesulfobacteriota bacterium]
MKGHEKASITIRQDQQDIQDLSFAFPDEKQKDLISLMGRCLRTGATNLESIFDISQYLFTWDDVFLSFVRKLRKKHVNPVNPV